ncbi:MAG: tetratricopeptide repeat protein [Acidobacteria bacterium]|nr:MAG: tetratricopeptide repeat protein [Acidobacteriota bacterium]
MSLPASIARPLALALIAVAWSAPVRAAEAPWTAFTALPEPPLDGIEPAVREVLAGRRRALEQAVATGELPPSRLAAIAGELCRAYHVHGFPAAARACYHALLEVDPRAPRWPYLLALLELEAGDLEAAVSGLERARGLAPDDLPTLLRLGDAYLRLGRLDDARTAYETALARRPDAAAALCGLGRLAQRAGDVERAIERFEACLERQPEAGQVHANLAQLYRRLGKAQPARRHAAAYRPSPVRFADPLLAELRASSALAERDLLAADRAFLEGRLDDALAAYRRAAASRPEDPRGLLGVASVLERRGQTRAAMEHYRQALRVDGELALAHLNLGALHARLGEDAAARRHLEAAVRLDPSDADAQRMLAVVLERNGEIEGALAAYRAAAQAAPEELEPLRAWADALARQRRFDPAAALYQQILERDPTLRQVRLAQAAALALGGRYPEARAALEAGLEALPGDPELSHALARLLVLCPLPAVRDPQRALELALEVYRATGELAHGETVAMAYAELGDFEAAATWQARLVAESEQRADAGVAERLRAGLERYRNGIRPSATSGGGGP